MVPDTGYAGYRIPNLFPPLFSLPGRRLNITSRSVTTLSLLIFCLPGGVLYSLVRVHVGLEARPVSLRRRGWRFRTVPARGDIENLLCRGKLDATTHTQRRAFSPYSRVPGDGQCSSPRVFHLGTPWHDPPLGRRQ